MLVCMDDMIIKKAEIQRQSDNVKDITNICLYSGLSYMIATGIIGTVFLGEMIIITLVNKSVKFGLKKSGLDSKLYNIIKMKRVINNA